MSLLHAWRQTCIQTEPIPKVAMIISYYGFTRRPLVVAMVIRIAQRGGVIGLSAALVLRQILAAGEGHLMPADSV